ncbi:2,4-dihydroxyhept-2-enedioate aldolase [Arboricoccus pini]|uniref:2,4-dihydroxyhept-2-enedioate aldolase n=1 Tax=Arboricoccus pini TaxID=1963835 RepID=A0A212QQ72_9PROT|nr:aldolase/citrate lyase family protein [Arboricoccus pini]SNB61633.1 2,4-dihydroxyhept-2-enedioate aldolase [Arboricoccus pini]
MASVELPRNAFKQAILAGRQQIGLWCSLASANAIEMLSFSGFDWLLLDTEHSPNELPMVLQQLHAAAAGPTHPIVRVPWNDTVLFKRYLDAGVQSFLVPMVQDAAEARRAVAATRYPPRGVRGFASASRSSRFGRIKDYHTRCEGEICVIVQIETVAAMRELEAIAAVEGVDGIFIGPGDLSADMGYLGQPGHPEVMKVALDAMRRIRAAGKAPGFLTGNETLARQVIEAGCLFTAVGSDTGLLVGASESLAARFKG